MTRHRIDIVVATVSLLLASLAIGLAEGTHPTRDFMKQKMTYAGGILEGITLEKFDLVVTNATLLRNMNMTNAFLALGNPDYKAGITNFQVQVDNLIGAAKNKRLELSTEAYADMVRSCVACHKTFRRAQLREGNFK